MDVVLEDKFWIRNRGSGLVFDGCAQMKYNVHVVQYIDEVKEPEVWSVACKEIEEPVKDNAIFCSMINRRGFDFSCLSNVLFIFDFYVVTVRWLHAMF